MGMFDFIKKINPLKKFTIPLKLGMKGIKYWIDNKFRDKVVPVEGSVLYSDLMGGVEHSGIYIGKRKISNIVVEGFGESEVKVSDLEEFVELQTG